jgi:trehalose-phosphatase
MARHLTAIMIRTLAGPLAVLRTGPRLLVLDFDGTLAPLAPRPSQARLSPAAARALRRLGAQPGVALAVLSGRALGDLRRLVPAGPALLGDHGLSGSAAGLGVAPARLAPWRRRLRARLAPLRALARAVPGALVEDKGCAAALHYRLCPPERVPALLAAAAHLFAGSGLRRRAGKRVLEWGPPLGGGKAGGLRRLAARLAPGWRRGGACLFIGDDVTDEDAFRAARALGGRVITVKVGPGPTAAAWRVARRDQVDALLAAVAGWSEGGAAAS